MKNVRVMIWGFGAMGSGIARALLSKRGIEIAGVYDLRPELVGQDLHEKLGLERPEGVPAVKISGDAFAGIQRGAADLVILATDSFTAGAYPKIKHCVEQGMNVISTAEEMSWPWVNEGKLSLEIDRLARQNGVTVFGTGVNPGFVLDYLILALSGCLIDLHRIEAARVNDLSPFGHAVMEEQGVGLEQEHFHAKMEADELAGHVGFPESISIILAGLGLPMHQIVQRKDPIVSETERKTPYAHVTPGQVAGIRQQGFGYIDEGDEPFISLDHPQQILPELEGTHTGDFIRLDSDDFAISMRIEPEIPGGIGTIAMCINMIPEVLNASPGLKSLLDLPVPRALLGDVRERLTAYREAPQIFHAGDLVMLRREILPAAERAPGLPAETAAEPLVAYYKGYLEAEAVTGDEVTIETFAGRKIQGTLCNRPVHYVHNFGEEVSELRQLRKYFKEMKEDLEDDRA